MSFFRKDKIDRPEKLVEGDPKLAKPRKPRVGPADRRDAMDIEDIRREAEDLQDLLEIENTELLINSKKLIQLLN